MNSDRDRELVELAARTFNVPPRVTPREEMWRQIRAARAKAPALSITAARVVAAPAVNGGGRGNWSGRRGGWRRGWIAASASLLAASLVFMVTQMQSGGTVAGGLGGWAVPQGPAPASAAGWQNVQLSATAAGFGLSSYDLSGSVPWHFASDDDPELEAFRRAALLHIRTSEAFVTRFRSMSREIAIGRQTRNSARALLSHTRLLISSPIAGRTQYRSLFQDLELVLMKVSLVSDSTLTADREQIETTLERRRLLPRMREMLPRQTSSSAD